MSKANEPFYWRNRLLSLVPVVQGLWLRSQRAARNASGHREKRQMPQMGSDGGAEEGMIDTEQGGRAEGPAEVAIGDEIDVMEGRAATSEKRERGTPSKERPPSTSYAGKHHG